MKARVFLLVAPLVSCAEILGIEAATVDAGVDGPLPDVGTDAAPQNDLGVVCGGDASCVPNTVGCCLRPFDVCCGGEPASSRVVLLCDDYADCPGEVCCYSVGDNGVDASEGPGAESACVADCFGPAGVIMCDPAVGGCPGPGTCVRSSFTDADLPTLVDDDSGLYGQCQ